MPELQEKKNLSFTAGKRIENLGIDKRYRYQYLPHAKRVLYHLS